MPLPTLGLASSVALAVVLALFPNPAYGAPYPVVLEAFAPAFFETGDDTWYNGRGSDLDWGRGSRFVEVGGSSDNTTCIGPDCLAGVRVQFYGSGIEFWGGWQRSESEEGAPLDGGALVLLDELDEGLVELDRNEGVSRSGPTRKLVEWSGRTGEKKFMLAPTWGAVALTHVIRYMEIEGR